MQRAPIFKDEHERLCAVLGLNLLDTPPEERFDKITREAMARFDVPISTITIIDKDREWYKSVQGLPAREGPRDISFCGHALSSENIYVIEDTFKNSAFADNPMVTGSPHIRFYAGKSLYDHKTGYPVGVFCIKSHEPRQMSAKDIVDFLDFARLAEIEINRETTTSKN